MSSAQPRKPLKPVIPSAGGLQGTAVPRPRLANEGRITFKAYGDPQAIDRSNYAAVTLC